MKITPSRLIRFGDFGHLSTVIGLTLILSLSVFANVQGLTILSLSRDPLLVKTLYAEPHRLASDIASDGSVSVNTDWEQEKSDTWFIEQQRYGGDFVQAGVCTNDDALISQGLKILDWGFARESADGSFPGTGDAFHSASMFVEGAARALLLLNEYDHARFAKVIDADVPKLRATAYWLLRPEVLEHGRKNDSPYTHRRFILAAALAQTAALSRDPKLASAALEFAQDGLRLQTADGIDPEKGGFDVSYQLVGLGMLERYYVLCSDLATRNQACAAMRKGLDWFATKLNSSGDVDLTGSTRVGIESGRSGKRKTFDPRAGLQALVNGSTITGVGQYRTYAEAIARGHGWIK